MRFFTVEDRRYARFDRLADEVGLVHAFSTRPDDVSAKSDAQAALRRARRSRFARDLGISAGRIHHCIQIHRPGISLIAHDTRSGPHENVDALITSAPGEALMTFSADCPLLLVYGSSPAVLGVAHASWRCTVAAIARRLVDFMSGALHCAPSTLRAGIGPSAGPCCYEVKEDVHQAAAGLPARETLFEKRDGRVYFDLWRANREQLLAAGLLAENIEIAGICTMCRTDLFYSFRREGSGCGHFGLMAALCGQS